MTLICIAFRCNSITTASIYIFIAFNFVRYVMVFDLPIIKWHFFLTGWIVDDLVGGDEDDLLNRLRTLCSPGGSEFGGESRRKSMAERVKGSCTKKFGTVFNFLTCHYILDADGTLINYPCLLSPSISCHVSFKIMLVQILIKSVVNWYINDLRNVLKLQVGRMLVGWWSCLFVFFTMLRSSLLELYFHIKQNQMYIYGNTLILWWISYILLI
jgi:hypothetical protein